MTARKNNNKDNTQAFQPSDAEKGVIATMSEAQADAILSHYNSVEKLPKDIIKPVLLTADMGLSDSSVNSDRYRKDLDYTFNEITAFGEKPIVVTHFLRKQVSALMDREQAGELEVLATALTKWAEFIMTQVSDVRAYSSAKDSLGINVSQALMVKRTAQAAKQLVSQKAEVLQALRLQEHAYELLLKTTTSEVEREIAGEQLEKIKADIEAAMSNQNLHKTY